MQQTTKHHHADKFSPDNREGGGVVFELRRALGLSRPAFSARTGISPATLSAIERRQGAPTDPDAISAVLIVALELPRDQLTAELETFIAQQKARYQQLAEIFGES